jgi:hypothetical protein
MKKSEAVNKAKKESILIRSEGAYGVSTVGSGWTGGLTYRQAQRLRGDIVLNRALRHMGYPDHQIAMLPFDVYSGSFRESLDLAIDILDTMST